MYPRKFIRTFFPHIPPDNKPRCQLSITAHDCLLCMFLNFWSPAKRRGHVAYNFGRVCLYVCLSDDNFQMPWCWKFIFAHRAYLHTLWIKIVFKGHWHWVKDSRSRLQEPKSWKFLFQQCKTLISNNSVSTKHRTMKFACSMGLFEYSGSNGVTLSRDRKWQCVTKSTHSRVICLILEGKLVFLYFYFTLISVTSWLSNQYSNRSKKCTVYTTVAGACIWIDVLFSRIQLWMTCLKLLHQ